MKSKECKYNSIEREIENEIIERNLNHQIIKTAKADVEDSEAFWNIKKLGDKLHQ